MRAGVDIGEYCNESGAREGIGIRGGEEGVEAKSRMKLSLVPNMDIAHFRHKLSKNWFSKKTQKGRGKGRSTNEQWKAGHSTTYLRPTYDD